MSYKNYSARIEYSDEDGCFIGHVAGINDVIGFHGDSVSQLRQAFEEAVDDYLETCQKLNRTPQRAYTGKIMLRLTPSLHARAAIQARNQGISLNAWAQEVFANALG